MRVSHFVSTSVSFSHIIYLPIETTPFEMLFSSVPFQKEILEREWKKRKDYFRKNALPIWNYNHKSLLRLLYHCKCTPANFLLKLVCRFRPHLLFKQIHLYGKLFIYEVYRRACGRGLYFPSIRVELYKKYTKRRMLPYFSQHIWKVAVTEYMTFYAIQVYYVK